MIKISDLQDIQERYGRKLARAAFRLNAIRLQPADPFTWASGYRMPIYNDNRQFLREAGLRQLIAQGFRELAEASRLTSTRIAGTATAGIPHATTLADMMELPLLYVRSSQKKHGMQNAIEGLESGKTLDGERVLLIEDLISTGGSSVKAVEALRAAGADVPLCLAIFTYGLTAAQDTFSALSPPCSFATLLSYSIMVEEAEQAGYIDAAGAADLTLWRQSPMTWGEERGFLRVKKD